MKNYIVFVTVFVLSINAYLPTVEAKNNGKPALGSRGGGILCTDQFPARSAQAAAMQAIQAEAWEFPPFPYEDTFLLHSYPSSDYKLYIDFDGYVDNWDPDNPVVYTAWDTDGDPSTFSEAERLVIQKAWYSVSEDFLPFTIDITTEDPGAGFPGMRAVVDGSHVYGYGWAYMGVWPNSDEYAYAHPGDDTWIWIGQMVSHEVGHTIDLYDHGQTDGTGYYMGHGEGWTMWGAIMGWDSWSLGVWDDGDFPIPNHPEDSIGIIVGSENPGVDFRPDDHGNNIGTATAVDITADLIAEGIIEQRSDVDYFSFTMASSGDVVITINGDVVMASTNLDVLAKIHDSGGAVLYESNPLLRLWATFNVTLAAGDYYISVDGTGYDDPGGIPSEGYGYSDYGIAGYYSIKKYTGDLNAPTPDRMTWATAPYATGDSSIAMVATTASDPDGVQYNFICTAGLGGHDSGWQDSASYEDTGLGGDIQYTYTVIALDKTVMANETAASTAESARTDVDTTAPAPDPMTWKTMPYSTDGSSITMVATTASDGPLGVEYYFACMSSGGHDSSWQDSSTYTDTGLTTGIEYTYTVTVRDKSPAQNTTAASAPASVIISLANLVLPSNGGVLESFTSEYGGGWVASDLTNGITDEDGWASAENPTSPQEFVYSFRYGNSAILNNAEIHGGTAEGQYFSKDVEIWTSADGTSFTLAASDMLDYTPNYSITIPLGDIEAKKIMLRITSGYWSDYWELAEFVVFGSQADPGQPLYTLADDIIDLDMHPGIENSLLAKIDTAIAKLEDDNPKNDKAAIASLQALINEVQAQRGKKISEEDADHLIAAAQQAIDALSQE